MTVVPSLYIVSQRKKESEDSFTVYLKPVAGQAPHFLPGQFNMIYAFAVGEVPISMSGDPDGEGFTHTIRTVGATTRVLSQLKRGDRVGVRGPFGSAWPVEKAEGHDLLLVAGGIGLAPLMPVLHVVAAHRKKFGKVTVLYGARTPQDLIFAKERVRFEQSNIEIDITVDSADAGWNRKVGVVTNLLGGRSFNAQNTLTMLCGPEIMMRFVIADLVKRGFSKDSIYLSMERNMKCGLGHCGHCQFMPHFICKDGPVFPYSIVEPFFGKKEV